MLDIIFGQAADPERCSGNEDAMGVYIPKSRGEIQARGCLFVLADGVGDHQTGGAASTTAVQVLIDGFARAEEQTSLSSLLPRLIQYANSAVRDEGLHPERRGKGIATTIVACAVRGDQAHIAHVGDSRCYLIRNGNAVPLTQEHTTVGELNPQGCISETKAFSLDSRNGLTRALGQERFVEVESTKLMLHPNDVLVLCSDSLSAAMGRETMAQIAAQATADAQEVAEELVHRAVTLDGSGNATAMVLCVRAVDKAAMFRGHSYVRSLV